MADSIFRKKSLDRIKTPDNLDQYIRVSNISGWILIISILLLLIGVVIWGCCGTIETKIQTQAFVENGTAVCSVSNENIKSGMVLRIDGIEGTVWNVEQNRITAKIEIPDGVYDATVILERIQPMALLFD